MREGGSKMAKAMKQASKSFGHQGNGAPKSKGLQEHVKETELMKENVGGSVQGSGEDDRWRVLSESRAESRAFMALLTSDSVKSNGSSIEHDLHGSSSRSEEDERPPQLLTSSSMSETGEDSDFSSFRTTFSSSSSSSSLPSLDTPSKEDDSSSSSFSSSGDGDTPSQKKLRASAAALSQQDSKGNALLQHSEFARPSHWSDRQLRLAMAGPLGFKGATLSEHMWFGLIRLRSLAILWLIYACQYILFAALALPPLLLDRQYAVLVYLSYMAVYSFVWMSNPERDGSRASASFQKWFGALMEEVSVLHFNGGVRIISDSDAPLSPSDKYIFGYHPHGLMPAILAWLPMTGAWRRLFPGVNPVGLVATAIFKVPILRDLNLWGGLREVSKASFVRALHEKKAVLLCPGGQAELSLHEHSSKKTVVLSARKAGFIKVAMETGSKLVPMVLFGESQLLDNPFDLPTAQRVTYKVLGFPIPFLPLGLFGLVPIPRRGSVAVVIGKPFDPRLASASRDTSPESVEAARKMYYTEVASLIERYQGHPEIGFGEWKYIVDVRR